MILRKKNKKAEYGKFIMDFMYREDNVFSSRVNLFLITESLLLLSYVTLLINNSLKRLCYYLSIAGIIITISYTIALIINLRYMRRLQNAALDTNLNYCPNYRKLKEEIYCIFDIHLLFRHPNLYLIFIPFVILIVWIIFLLQNLNLLSIFDFLLP